VGLKPFGFLTTERAVRIVLEDGTSVPVQVSGFDHFA
jgi:hypothetical protein